MRTRLLDSIEARLHHHAAQLGLSDLQTDRARSLAIAGTCGALLGLTPAELFILLEPAFMRWQAMQRPHVETVEGEEARNE